MELLYYSSNVLLKTFVHFDVFPKEYIEDSGLTDERNEIQTKLQVELREKIEKQTWSFEEGLQIQRDKMKFTYEKTSQISDAIDGLHNNIHNRIYERNLIFPLAIFYLKNMNSLVQITMKNTFH